MAVRESAGQDAVARERRRGVSQAAAAGADFFGCPDGTAHSLLDRHAGTPPIPGPQIVDAVRGARYDPVTDLWSPASLVDAPEGRGYPSAVWTGGSMFVWGGRDGPVRDSDALVSGAARSNVGIRRPAPERPGTGRALDGRKHESGRTPSHGSPGSPVDQRFRSPGRRSRAAVTPRAQARP